MNRQDQQTLDDLIRDLLSAQDNVTHLNEKGRDYEQQTHRAIRHRDEVKRRLVAFIEFRVDDEML